MNTTIMVCLPKASQRDPGSPARVGIAPRGCRARLAGDMTLGSGRWGGVVLSKLAARQVNSARPALFNFLAFQKESGFRFETGLFSVESTLIATRKAGFASNCASLRRREARRVETADFQIDATYPGAKMRGGHLIACSDRGRPSNKPLCHVAEP